ncbi:MAG TPA: hypothetical protein VE990_09575 [Acidimicrobiales bacterium]|nr:hypothetical protein [Acidimicrobiales bacterium]
MQLPAYVTGTVSVGGRPAAGVTVIASGKDGDHQVRADSAGGFHISLLTGLWLLSARAGGASGPAVRLHLQPGQQIHQDLQAP